MKRRVQEKRFSEINAIPLIDVLLVLLVIFMVTAPLYLQEIQLELPTVDSSQASIEPKPTDLTLFIKSNGQLYLDDMTSKHLTLKEVLSKVASKAKQSKPDIYIQADKNCPYGTVVTVLAAIEGSGISQFHLVNTNEQTPKPSA